MKTYILFAVLWLGLTWKTSAQPCSQITINDPTQQKVLSTYINESEKKGSFAGDKGVIIINRFVNEAGRPSWLVQTVIDDNYKDNPPSEWASFDRDIILFYDTRSSRYDIIKHTATPELLQCLDEAIGDRLYIRPSKRDRWMDVPGVNGKTRKVNARRIYAGSSGNGQVVIFESDGRVTVLQSV